MKKIILGIAGIVVLGTANLVAQDGIEMRIDGVGPDVSGTTVSTSLYANSPELSGGIYQIHFAVTNNTGSDKQWLVTRVKMNVSPGWTDQVCWPPGCYDAPGDSYSTPNSGGNPAPIIQNGILVSLSGAGGTADLSINGTNYPVVYNTNLTTTAADFVTNNAAAILSNEGLTVVNNGIDLYFTGTLPSQPIELVNIVQSGSLAVLKLLYPNELKPRITPDPLVAGYGHYRYYLTDVNTWENADSVDLILGYVLNVNNLKQNSSLSISPNPADDNVNINIGTMENASIKVLDVLGNVIMTESMSSGTKNLDVSGFKNGVYFVIVEANGVKPVNRKLIVRH